MGAFWERINNRWKMRSNDVDVSIQSIYKGHLRVKYRGITAYRSPFDYVIYQMLLHKIRPDLVIEIGTHEGGGALYLADLMNALDHGIVHTINIEDRSAQEVKLHPRITRFTEGWENYDISLANQFSTVLIIDDGSHMYNQTLEALKKFSPLVTPDSYYIVEDGIVTELGMSDQFDGGPIRAIHEFLAENRHFEIDRSWCDLFGRNATFNVNGYLRRKR